MLIKNALIIDFSNAIVKGPKDILIRGNLISEISDRIDVVETEVIDATGCYVSPGLTNLHAHVPMTLLRGCAEDLTPEEWFNTRIWIYERNLEKGDVYLGALLGACEMLQNGVTTVFDHYFSMDEAYRAYKESGIRADLAWAVFGSGDNSAEAFDESMRFVEKFAGLEDRLTVSLGPHSPYICPQDFLKKIVSIAESTGLKIHIHASEVASQVKKSLLEKGFTPIQYLHEIGVLRDKTILAHAYYATPKDFDLIRECGSCIAHAPKTYMRFADIYDFLPKALSKKVKVGLATDGAASNGDLSIFEAAKMAALLAKISTKDPHQGSVKDVIALLSKGEDFLGKKISAVEVGYVADLIIIDGSSVNLSPATDLFANIVYGISRSDIKTVIVDGKKVVEEGKVLTVDVDAVVKEATIASKRLIEKRTDKPMQFFG